MNEQDMNNNWLLPDHTWIDDSLFITSATGLLVPTVKIIIVTLIRTLLLRLLT